MYKIGQFFYIGSNTRDIYLLAAAAPSSVSLIGLHSGNRYADPPVRVEDVMNVSLREIQVAAGNETVRLVEVIIE